MLGRIACALGALFVGGAMISCGPPPPPLGGSITYGDMCMGGPGNMGVVCSGQVTEGANGEMSGAERKIFACFISSDGNTTRLSFRVGTTTDPSVPTPRPGISACGEVSGPGADLTNGTAQLYFSSGTDATNVPLTGSMGGCEIKIISLTPTGASPGFTGQIRCQGVNDNGVPMVTHNITGLMGQTMAPDFGDFEFHTCGTIVPPCTH